MPWSIEYTTASRRLLKKLDPPIASQILETMKQVLGDEDPYQRGKALTGNWSGHWRYRSGVYRIICRLHNRIMVIEVVKAGHRSSVYDRP